MNNTLRLLLLLALTGCGSLKKKQKGVVNYEITPYGRQVSHSFDIDEELNKPFYSTVSQRDSRGNVSFSSPTEQITGVSISTPHFNFSTSSLSDLISPEGFGRLSEEDRLSALDARYGNEGFSTGSFSYFSDFVMLNISQSKFVGPIDPVFSIPSYEEPSRDEEDAQVLQKAAEQRQLEQDYNEYLDTIEEVFYQTSVVEAFVNIAATDASYQAAFIPTMVPAKRATLSLLTRFSYQKTFISSSSSLVPVEMAPVFNSDVNLRQLEIYSIGVQPGIAIASFGNPKSSFGKVTYFKAGFFVGGNVHDQYLTYIDSDDNRNLVERTNNFAPEYRAMLGVGWLLKPINFGLHYEYISTSSQLSENMLSVDQNDFYFYIGAGF